MPLNMRNTVLVVLFAFTLGFGCAELLTRIFVPDPRMSFENRVGLFRPDSVTGYRNQPNYDAYAQGFIRVRTNALGYRGKAITPQKPPGTYRIAALGDSVTWGVGVQEEHTYVRRLEDALNAAPHAASRFEVINMGVIGYSLHQEVLFLQKYALRLSPDLVTIGFVANDFYPTEDPFFNINAFHKPPKADVKRRMYEDPPPPRSYFAQLIRTHLRRFRASKTSEAAPAPPATGPQNSFEAAALPLLKEHLHTARVAAAQSGVKILVLIFPTRPQLMAHSKPAFPQDSAKRFCEEEGLPYLDLTPALETHVEKGFLDTMHLSDSGHRVVSEQLASYIREQKWLAQTR
jgi:lysophospholipase L1-like esterase